MLRNRPTSDARRRDAPVLLALVSLLASPLACAPAPALPEPVELAVLSYNLRHNVDFYDERMELMADGIAALAPDVIGLQEIEIAVEQGQILAEMIEERNPKLRYELRQVLKPGAAGALTGEGVGIMSLHPMSDVEILEMDEGRVSLFARMRDVGGHAVSFVSTHLTSDGGDELRALQALDTVAFLDEHSQTGDARVLVGDFNADPEDGAVQNVLESGYLDTYLEVHGEETTLTQGNTSPVALGTDDPAQDFRRRIDYVFAHPGDALVVVRPLESAVVLDEPRADGLYPSDHLGVLTTLRVEAQRLPSPD